MSRNETIRQLTLEEAGELVRWARDEGWNPGPGDARAFYAADPQGFLGCFVDEQLIAGISAVTYGPGFGFIGLYICKPEFRGKGHGLKVWNAGMTRLRGRTIGLDGVTQQQANYVAMGFEKAYETHRWSGLCQGQFSSVTGAAALDPASHDAIIGYDRQFFPGPRGSFLKSWLTPPRHAFALVVDGDVAGYAVARACAEGYKLGPLFADGIRQAQQLLAAAVEACEGETLHLDVPAYQGDFANLLAGNGFTRGFETARMYKGTAPEIDSHGVFAVTSLELG